MTGNRPAHEFEQATGMAGIARSYALPNDMDYKRAEHLIRFGLELADQYNSLSLPWENPAQKRLLIFMDTVLELNRGSGLEHIQVDRSSLSEVRHFLLGVVSGLNPDDIDYFIHDYTDPMDYLTSETLNALLKSNSRISSSTEGYEGHVAHVSRNAFANKLQVPVTWVPSPQTEQKIRDHFGLQGWTPSADELYQAELSALERKEYVPIMLYGSQEQDDDPAVS